MNILVTGGAGFVGTNLIKRLVKDNHSISCIDNYISGYRTNHIPGVQYYNLDIEKVSSLGSNWDIIFHLAALSRIQPSFKDPYETFRVNTLGTQKVLELARESKSKVIYAGSSSKHHNPYQSPYATYKYLGEEVCKMYKISYLMNIEIARFYNVYGPNEIVEGDWAPVTGIWRNQINNNLPITIVGDGTQSRDFTHVEDIVDGLYKIAMSNKTHEDAWELGTGVSYSINEVFSFFEERFGELEKKYIPQQSGNYAKTLRENNDAINMLNWSPQDRLKQYILSL